MSGIPAFVDPEDFPAFFEAVHGHPPHPWQARLAARVVESGAWPDLLDLPTGAGKTAAIDVALFHLAVDASRPAEQRTAPRRVVLVVDRRVVVDQGFDRAEHIARALYAARGDVLSRTAAALRSLFGGREEEPPVIPVVLRGGMVRDDGWVRRPDQPTVVASTVDQVGSRLLFRGYGVSPAMRPIHAGLLGNDVLYLLDEVQLAKPFEETLTALEVCRPVRGLPRRWGVVRMSATPEQAPTETFGLCQEDRDPMEAPELHKRLTAPKPAKLIEVKTKKTHTPARKRKLIADEATRAVETFLKEEGHASIGVVVNRVDTARRVAAALSEAPCNLHLLTGRMRPLDRDDALARVRSDLKAANGRGNRPVVVVGTQSLEAGADFDFQALVTELASLDSLRQRFGRLNRSGDQPDARAVVLVPASDVAANAPPDPVYGTTLGPTHAWLTEQSELDFGSDAFALPSTEALGEMVAKGHGAPVLMPTHLDGWSCTTHVGPLAPVVPEVALWLHGAHPKGDDVQIVWRADVREEDLAAAAGHGETHNGSAVTAAGLLGDLVATVPPASVEALPVPLSAARAWLAGTVADTGVADAPQTDESAVPESHESQHPRLALRWQGDDPSVVGPAQIRPADTLIVPASYGGLRLGNFDPSASDTVTDLGDRAQYESRGRAVLRLLPEVLAPWVRAPGAEQEAEAEGDDAPIALLPQASRNETADPTEAIREALTSLRQRAAEPWIDAAAEVLADRLRHPGTVLFRRSPTRRQPHIVLSHRRPTQHDEEALWRTPGVASTDEETSSFNERAVELERHLADVGRWTKWICEACGLSETLADDLTLAGELHDLGKADPRFQAMLHGGDEVAAAMAQASEVTLLAKSDMAADDRRARRLARERSGYPRGARHELLSVALAESEPALLAGANEPELVLHLVASHHGYARPFGPPILDQESSPARVSWNGRMLAAPPSAAPGAPGSSVPERFHRLSARYGWHGLAWLEAILRLADHRASEEEALPGLPEAATSGGG